MEKLVEYFTSRIGITIIIIVCFFIPGVLFVFIWNRNLFINLDFFKLLLLIFSIPISIFCLNMVGFSGIYLRRADSKIGMIMILILTDFELYLPLFLKLRGVVFSVYEYISIIMCVAGLFFLFDCIIKIPTKIKQTIKQINEKSKK